MEFGVSRQIATIRIDCKSRGRIPAGERITNLPSDRARSIPGLRVRKLAEPFAEPHRRCVGIEWVGSAALRAGPAPFDAETDRHHELMLGVLEEPIFECGVEILEAGCSHGIWSSRRSEAAVG